MFPFPMRKRISPLPTSILALAALRNGRPRMSSIPRSPSISMTTKFARMKESCTRTRTFLAIPSGYRIVESVSCTNIYVWERAGYKSFSYITMGIMLTLALRLQSACSWIFLNCCYQAIPSVILRGIVPTCMVSAGSLPGKVAPPGRHHICSLNGRFGCPGVAKMASHAIFQYNVLAIDDTHNT